MKAHRSGISLVILGGLLLIISTIAVDTLGMAQPAGAVRASKSSNTDLYSWGWNDSGGLALGVPTGPDNCGEWSCSLIPREADLPKGSVPAAVLGGGLDFGLLLQSNGSLLSFGDNGNGELGSNGPNSDVPIPVVLPTGDVVTYLAASGATSYASTTGGQLLSWGAWPLGDCSSSSSDSPVDVELPPNVSPISISGGLNTAGAVGSDGLIYMWGQDNYGQLGDGGTADQSCPIAIRLPGGAKAQSLSVGEYFGLAVSTAGQVMFWGNSTAGSTPQLATMPAGVTAIKVAQGRYTGYMIGSNGNAYQWTNGSFTSTPTLVVLPSGVTAQDISTGGSGTSHVMLLGSDGNVYSWGQNDRGQFGVGTCSSSDVETPVAAELPAGLHAVAIGAGGYTGYAILTTSSVPSITTFSVPKATVGQPYSFQLEASGGTPPYVWHMDNSKVLGKLPPKIRLSGSGLLSGKPKAAGSFSFEVKVSDATNSRDAQAVKRFTLTVDS